MRPAIFYCFLHLISLFSSSTCRRGSRGITEVSLNYCDKLHTRLSIKFLQGSLGNAKQTPSSGTQLWQTHLWCKVQVPRFDLTFGQRSLTVAGWRFTWLIRNGTQAVCSAVSCAATCWKFTTLPLASLVARLFESRLSLSASSYIKEPAPPSSYAPNLQMKAIDDDINTGKLQHI